MSKDVSAAGPARAVPPYLPYTTFINTTQGWRVALPQRIDRSILGSYSGAMQTWMMSALRYFGLITGDGFPTDRLRQLTDQSLLDVDRRKILRDLVTRGYPFLFESGFDLAKATPAQIQEKFKSTGAQGETLSKCLSFFTALAKDAGVAVTPFLRTRQRVAGNGRKAKPTKAVSKAAQIAKNESAAFERTHLQILIDMLDPDEMDEKEEQAVWTLIRYLKKREGKS